MDRPALLGFGSGHIVDGLAEKVEYTAEAFFADRDRDRTFGIDRVHTLDKAVGRTHSNTAYNIIADLLGDFGYDCPFGGLDLERV